jgi:hypothetical protein
VKYNPASGKDETTYTLYDEPKRDEIHQAICSIIEGPGPERDRWQEVEAMNDVIAQSGGKRATAQSR